MCLPLGFCGPEKRQEEEYDPDLECSFEGSMKGVVPFYFGKNTSMVTYPSKQGSEEEVREVEENRVQVAFRNVHVNMEVAKGSSVPHHGKKEVLGTTEINDALGDLCHTAMNRRVEQLALKDVSFQSAKTQQKFFQYIVGHFAGDQRSPVPGRQSHRSSQAAERWRASRCQRLFHAPHPAAVSAMAVQ